MQSLSKDDLELELMSALLTRLNIAITIVAEEDKEDIGMGILLQEANRSEYVSRTSIFEALSDL